jgi:heme exporter protein D
VSEFLHMGGYAAYVWSAYAIAAVVLGLNAIVPALRERAELATLARRRAPRDHADDATA